MDRRTFLETSLVAATAVTVTPAEAKKLEYCFHIQPTWENLIECFYFSEGDVFRNNTPLRYKVNLRTVGAQLGPFEQGPDEINTLIPEQDLSELPPLPDHLWDEDFQLRPGVTVEEATQALQAAGLQLGEMFHVTHVCTEDMRMIGVRRSEYNSWAPATQVPEDLQRKLVRHMEGHAVGLPKAITTMFQMLVHGDQVTLDSVVVYT